LEGLRPHAPVLIPALLAFGAVSLAVPRMRRGWAQFAGGTRLRRFIGIVAVTLAWGGSAYAYTAWYGQAHLPDRLMLIALAGLVVWRPLFVLPFACAFWTIVWQFNAPALGFTALVADFRPLVHTLTL